jgi:hypothetical protein
LNQSSYQILSHGSVTFAVTSKVAEELHQVIELALFHNDEILGVMQLKDFFA